jgi:flagellar P-ring protein precursor FlgI
MTHPGLSSPSRRASAAILPGSGRAALSRLARGAAALCLGLGLCLAGAGPAAALSRIKDLAQIEGVRQNQLVGYGLVVGLNGTGDTLNNAPFTKQSLQAMLERLGVNTRGAQLRTANVAAVMVTANLPAFATQGTRLDVTVSALGDAKSLQGGTLLVTPLLGATGRCTRWARARWRSRASRRRGTRPRSPGACPPSGASPTGR